MNTRKMNIVIVGAGFGGLAAAKSLAGIKECDILVLDQNNYHLFQPLLYQVAMAALSPAEIAVPIRSELSSQKNVQVLLGKVMRVDLSQHFISTDFDCFHYDYLILACGANHSYFQHPEWEEFAPGLKTLEQATEIRRRVLLAFELAEREKNPSRKTQLLSFVIIGGGPTGVELAGALAEISRLTIQKDFRSIDFSEIQILLIEAGSHILPTFSQESSDKATKDLQSMGVTVLSNSKVTNITSEGIYIGSHFIPSMTILWAAGVRASRINESLCLPLDPQGRAFVGSDLSIPGHPEVFIIGDQAHAVENGKTLPGLAPIAIQQGIFVAQTIQCDLKNNARKPFHSVDKGQLATIGRKLAVGEYKGLRFQGLFAWLLWMIIHIYYLVGFKNRIWVFGEWLWSYVFFQRGARLIIHKNWKSDDSPIDLP